MNAAAGESRKQIAADTSDSVPTRCRGTCPGSERMRSCISGGYWSIRWRRSSRRDRVDPHRRPLGGGGFGEIQHAGARRAEWPMLGMPCHMSAMMLTMAPACPSAAARFIHCV